MLSGSSREPRIRKTTGAFTDYRRAVGKPSQLPRRISQRTGQKLLEAHGWVRETGGKHVVKMVKQGERPITLPAHKGQDYGVDLTRAILKQAGILPLPAEQD